jgi:hypothetical protein
MFASAIASGRPVGRGGNGFSLSSPLYLRQLSPSFTTQRHPLLLYYVWICE